MLNKNPDSQFPRPREKPKLSRYLTHAVLFVCCPAAIFLGSMNLADYSTRPGAQGDILRDQLPVELLESAGIEVSQPRFNLLFFIHPHCPCTVSAIRNLERLNARFPVHPDILAIVYCPEKVEDSWIQSRNMEAIQRLRKARVIVDHGAKLSDQFAVKTSGHLLLYSPENRLVFSGGITPFRGHEGDSLQAINLYEKICGENCEFDAWPVYGCPLRDPSAEKQ